VLSEEEVRRIVKEVIARLNGRISIEELREELNIGLTSGYNIRTLNT